MEHFANKDGLYIFFFGLGFLMGYLISIKALDRVYKEVMGRTIDEIHRQYKKALGRKEKENEGNNLSSRTNIS